MELTKKEKRKFIEREIQRIHKLFKDFSQLEIEEALKYRGFRALKTMDSDTQVWVSFEGFPESDIIIYIDFFTMRYHIFLYEDSEKFWW